MLYCFSSKIGKFYSQINVDDINLNYCSESLIYDFDTLLPFPSPADFYALETFKPNLAVKDEFKHLFRFIPAETYLNHFESDRSHMVSISSIHNTHTCKPIHFFLCTVECKW
jgi:hypothetical protein